MTAVVTIDGTAITSSTIVLTNVQNYFDTDNTVVQPEASLSGGAWFGYQKRNPLRLVLTFYVSNTSGILAQDDVLKIQALANKKEEVSLVIRDHAYDRVYEAIIANISVPVDHFNINFYKEINIIVDVPKGYGKLATRGSGGTVYSATSTDNFTGTTGNITVANPSKGERYTGRIRITTPASPGTQIKLTNSDGRSVWVDNPQASKTYIFNFEELRVSISPSTNPERAKGDMSNFLMKGLSYDFERTGGTGTWVVETTLESIC